MTPPDDTTTDLHAVISALREERDALAAALARRNSEYGERIEHQSATIDVLKTMSASRDDPQLVFNLIARRAAQLCNVPAVAVGAVCVPLKAGDASSAPPAVVMSEACSVTAPVRPFQLLTPATTPDNAAVTTAVVAICVLFVPGAAVGAVGVPEKLGLAVGAPPTPVTSAKVNVTAPVRLLKLDTAPSAIAEVT